jgi:hypothetical protein
MRIAAEHSASIFAALPPSRANHLVVGSGPLPRLVRLAATLAALVALRPASAQEGLSAEGARAEGVTPAPKRLPAVGVRTTLREESLNPLRQSVLVFDQSVTTQTAGLGPSPQSYVPLYELWLSFRPRYYFDEHWSVRGRFDYTKELTNNQATTYYREDVFGDIWTDLVYSTKLDRWWPGSKANAGVRALWPTSKASQANGTYVTLGARGGAEHKFEIRGEDAAALNDFHVGVSFSYLHPFTSATTPTSYGGFAYARQDVDEHSFISDQLTGQTLAEHTFWAILDTGLQMTPRLSLTADFITISQWHYAPTNGSIGIATGSVFLGRSGSDNQFTQSDWLTVDVDYALRDEIDLSLGYYNLVNANAPDGQVRSVFGSDTIWWSPDARFFFDITANLDILFDDATRKAPHPAAGLARSQRKSLHF